MVGSGALDRFSRRTPPVLRAVRIVHAVGIAESAAAERLGPLLARGRNPLVGITAKDGELVFRIRAEAESAAGAEAAAATDAAAIREALAPHVYSTEGEPLAAVLLDRLRRRGLRLAVAESLTGGLVADLLTAIPGSSEVFLSGVVAYADAEKTRLLSVPADLIATVGAVSREVALAMAEGMRRSSGADIAIATTGIAGPGGARPGKPVGLAWVAVASAVGRAAESRIHAGARPEVKAKSARHALDLLRRHLDGT